MRLRDLQPQIVLAYTIYIFVVTCNLDYVQRDGARPSTSKGTGSDDMDGDDDDDDDNDGMSEPTSSTGSDSDGQC